MSATARLLAAIGLNNEQFKNGIAATRSQTSGLHKDFSALKTAIAGAFTVGAVVSFANSIRRYAEDQADAAAATGANTTSIQALNAVAQDNAADSEKMRAALEKVRTAQISALESTGAARTAFEKLGISMTDIEGVGADRVFELIGQKIVTAENKTTALSAAGDILGAKLINKLLPSLRAVGEEGLDALNKRLSDSGRIMDETTIAKIDILSDKWNAFITRLLVGATKVIGFFERLGGAIGEVQERASAVEKYLGIFDPRNWAMFREGWDSVAQLQEQAEKRAIQAAKDANAVILANEDETAQKRIELADLVAKAKEEAALAEIAAAKEIQARIDAINSEAETKAYEAAAAIADAAQIQMEAELAAAEKVGDAQKTLAAIKYRIYFDSLSSEQQLALLIEKRARLEAERAAIFETGADKTTEGQLRQIELEKQLALLGEDIADRTKVNAKVTSEAKIEDVKLTEDQVKALASLQKLFKKMSDKELADFIQDMNDLHTGIGNLDFSGLNGLAALKGFKIPKTSVDDAKEFGAAIAAMFIAIAAVPKIPDLTPLDHLKDLKFSSDDAKNLGKMGNAILRFLEDLNNTPLDLGELKSIADLFDAIKGGSVSIKLTAPTKDQLTLSVDESFKSDMSSLASSAKIIADFKGVLFG